MIKHHVEIKKLGQKAQGYRVLASWKRPKVLNQKCVDAWVPGLAPSHIIRERYEDGVVSWKEFAQMYQNELRAPSCQNFLKPLALLSQRRKVILLCDCPKESSRCPTKILTQAAEECRKKKDFILEFSKRKKGGCHET